MYGAQAASANDPAELLFENDVEMYGAQAGQRKTTKHTGLRMM